MSNLSTRPAGPLSLLYLAVPDLGGFQGQLMISQIEYSHHCTKVLGKRGRTSLKPACTSVCYSLSHPPPSSFTFCLGSLSLSCLQQQHRASSSPPSFNLGLLLLSAFSLPFKIEEFLSNILLNSLSMNDNPEDKATGPHGPGDTDSIRSEGKPSHPSVIKNLNHFDLGLFGLWTSEILIFLQGH